MSRYIKIISKIYCNDIISEDIGIFPDNFSDSLIDLFSSGLAEDNALDVKDIQQDFDIHPDQYETKEEYLEALNEAETEYILSARGYWEDITKEEYDEWRISHEGQGNCVYSLSSRKEL